MKPDLTPPTLPETSAQLTYKRHWPYILIALVVVVAGALIFWLTRSEKPEPKPNNATSHTDTTLNTPVVHMDLVTKGLNLPTAIISTPDLSDKRLFVLEQAGKIRILSAKGKLETKPFLDISSKVMPGGEMGLLGLVFHPSYKQNGYFYVDYVDKNQNTTVARFKVQGGVADISSEKVLFTLEQPYSNHNGGSLAFGPDDYLYVSLGDGGSAGDPQNRAQNKDSFFGKILRLDVDKNTPYAIPSSNPFANESGVKPETWAYGLRNPWRISFDKKTGDLYIADVGQGDFEEINVQKSSSKGGENYGWRCYEGRHEYETSGCGKQSEYIQPAFEYNHEDGRCSITGGYVYRGTKYPALDGKYFYGDYCNGQLFYASQENGVWKQVEAAKTSYSISIFGQGSDDELYVADYQSGNIYHLQDAANQPKN